MKKYFSYILIFLAVVSPGFFVYKKYNTLPEKSITKTEDSSIEQDIDPNTPTLVNGEYKNPLLGFTMRVPQPLQASSFEEGEGYNVLIKGDIAGIKDFSMQIYVTPFDLDTPISVSMIKKDVPDLKILEPIEIKTDGAPTVAFFSNENGEKQRQIWFIQNFNLYQIITKAEHDNIVGKMMETWKWAE